MENLRIEGRIWLESSKGIKIGKGKAMLMNQIDKMGSIAAAARHLKIPYRKAWGMIQELNEKNNVPLVVKNIGGKEGGGTYLTIEGKKILKKFYEIEQHFKEFKACNL